MRAAEQPGAFRGFWAAPAAGDPSHQSRDLSYTAPLLCLWGLGVCRYHPCSPFSLTLLLLHPHGWLSPPPQLP